jgi:predicted Ser/Thr protein kinase
MSTDSRIGSEIAGYRIERFLARGGMSVVYLAEDTGLARKVALKLLAPELSEDQAFRDRFIRESRAAASLDHPNVIPIYGAGEEQGILWIAMRFVEGEDLARLIEREGPLPLSRTVSIVSQVGEALEAAHDKGVVHRDVKPGNILIGKGDHAYLTDFGLIKRRDAASRYTKTGEFMGSVDYAAPEQIRGEDVDPRADIYSLGCLLYECVTGEPPFPRESEVAVIWAHLNDPAPRPSVERPELPRGLDLVVGRALAKNPDARYPHGRDVAEAARDAIHPSVAGRVTRTRRPPPPPSRRRAIIGLAAVGVAVVVTLAVILLVRSNGSGPSTGAHGSALVRIDASRNRVATRFGDVAEFDPRAPVRVVAGEGAVWLLKAGGTTFGTAHLVKVDPSRGTTRTVPGVPPLADSITVGFHFVWAAGADQIRQIAPATGQPAKRISVQVTNTFGHAPILAAHGSLWFATTATLFKIDPLTGTMRRIELPFAPDFLVSTEDSVWAVEGLTGTFLAIDPGTGRAGAAFEESLTPDALAAGAQEIWLANRSAGTVARVDTTARDVGNQIPVGRDPFAIAVAEDAVWVAVAGDHEVVRIDPGVGQVVERIRVPGRPVALAVSGAQVWVFVAEA